MNQRAAVDFLAGMLGGWLGVDQKKPRKGEREIVTKFGDRVMLAYSLAEEELNDLRGTPRAT